MNRKQQDVFESIRTGLQEAIDYERGTLKQPVRTRKVTIAPLPHYRGAAIKQIRQKLNMTQSLFAEILGVSIKTIEAWEADRNEPEGPAQRMLSLLEAGHEFLEHYHLVRVSS